MVTIGATIAWDGPGVDILRVFAEPSPASGAEVVNEDVVVFRALDDDEEPTGEVTGIEIVGFLSFDRWSELPALPVLWRLPGAEPLPLPVLLGRIQEELRQRHKAGAA